MAERARAAHEERLRVLSRQRAEVYGERGAGHIVTALAKPAARARWRSGAAGRAWCVVAIRDGGMPELLTLAPAKLASKTAAFSCEACDSPLAPDASARRRQRVYASTPVSARCRLGTTAVRGIDLGWRKAMPCFTTTSRPWADLGNPPRSGRIYRCCCMSLFRWHAAGPALCGLREESRAVARGATREMHAPPGRSSVNGNVGRIDNDMAGVSGHLHTTIVTVNAPTLASDGTVQMTLPRAAPNRCQARASGRRSAHESGRRRR